MTSVRRAGPGGGETYAFEAKPQPIDAGGGGGGRQRYRDPDARPYNIMTDPRVVRGSTYAPQTLPVTAEPDPLELQRRAERAKRAKRKRIERERQRKERARTPPAVEGRVHRDVQTELYLEEIRDRPMEADIGVQTDQFLDRPPSPVFVPAKMGVDAETQVYDGDLFNFDFEVEPILEVLVGKTLEQSLMEVVEEEELEAMREHQLEFQRRRDAELVETQRLETQEHRRFVEKERRLAQERARVERELQVRQKVAARAYAQTYLSDLMGNVFGSLHETGFFYDTVERDVETGFMPWLASAVDARLERVAAATALVDTLLGDAIEARSGVFEDHQEALAEAAAQKRVADEEKRLADLLKQAVAQREARETLPRDDDGAYSGDSEFGRGGGRGRGRDDDRGRRSRGRRDDRAVSPDPSNRSYSYSSGGSSYVRRR